MASIGDDSANVDDMNPIQNFKTSKIAEAFCDFSLVPDDDGKNSKIQLSHCYPDNSLNKLGIDKGSLRTLSFPSGLLIVDRMSNTPPKIHIFNVTLQDYTQYTGVALTFFEDLPYESMTHIANKFGNFQSTNSDHSKSDRVNIFELDTMFSNYMNNNPSIKNDHVDGDVADKFKNIFLISRVICFISKNNSVNLLIEGLKIIYASIKQNLEIASIVKQYIQEISMPSIGISTIYSFGSTELPQIFQYSARLDNISAPDYKLVYLFNFFSLESLVTLFACVMLENQIILLSNSTYKLSLVANSLRYLIFPFYWDHIFVSLLPQSLIHSLEAPCPYIMGVQSSSSINIGMNSSKSNMRCIVDIDCGRVMCNDEIPTIPRCDELLNKLKMILDAYKPNGGLYETTKFHSGVSKAKKNTSANIAQHIHTHNSHDDVDIWKDLGSEYLLTQIDIMFNNEILCAFLDLFTSIFETYNKYIIWPTVSKAEFEHSSNTKQITFGQTAFLCSQNFQDLPFLSQFIESQLFMSFIYNKIKNIWGKTTKSNFIFDSILANSSNVKLTKRDLSAKKVKRIELPKDFDPRFFLSIAREGFDFNTGDYDWKNNFDNLIDYERNVKHESNDESFDSFDVNVDAFTEFGKSKTQESKNLNAIKGLLIDLKVRINQILVFKLDHNNFSNYVEDRTINSEVQLCSSLLSILRRIFQHGLMESISYRNLYQKFAECSPSDTPLWLLISNHYKVVCEHSKHIIHNSDFKLRNSTFDENANLLEIPDIKTDFLSIYNFIIDLNLETPEQCEEAWLYLLLEKNSISDIFTKIVDNCSSFSIYYRWSFLRRNNFAMSLVHHLKNLDQISFECFTKTYGCKKIHYRILTFVDSFPSPNLQFIFEFINNSGRKVKYIIKNLFPEVIIKLAELSDVKLLRIYTKNDSEIKYHMKLLYIIFRNEITGKSQVFYFNRFLSNKSGDYCTSALSCACPLPLDYGKNNIIASNENLFTNFLNNSLLCRLKSRSGVSALFNFRNILRNPIYPPQENTPTDTISQKQSQAVVDRLVDILSSTNTACSKDEIINVAFGQHGILEVLVFILKYNFGQFQIVEIFNGMKHPLDMLLYFKNLWKRNLFTNRSLDEHQKSMRIIFGLLEQVCGINDNYCRDEKLMIFLWILCNKKYLIDLIEVILKSNYQAQFYDKISFIRNIHLLAAAKRLIIQLHNHELIKLKYFRSDFPYSNFIK
ncbi:MAG: DENN domain-containing protein 5B, variant 2 [Marteilia pararefringens]